MRKTHKDESNQNPDRERGQEKKSLGDQNNKNSDG